MDCPPVYDAAQLVGQPWEQVEKVCRDTEFWFKLQPLPWALRLVRALKAQSDLYICSQPWHDMASCHAAKLMWCYKHLRIDYDRVILTPHKHLLAARGRVLIDDLPENLSKWRMAEGCGVLFPARHNGWAQATDVSDPSMVIDYVFEKIRDQLTLDAHLASGAN
jgi:5'(3')-deoxyribonucleotidase